MFSKKKKIKVLDIQGVISTGKRGGYNHYKILENLYNIRTEDKIAGVILRINSPGGSAGASSELAKEIEAVNAKIPVLISISDICCSGGYMAAAPAKEIWASPMALVGSIGVIIQTPDVQSLAEKIGVKMRVIKSADMKDIGSPFRDMTDAERKVFQDLIDEGYKDFVDFVLSKRTEILPENVDEESKNSVIKEIASGAIFTANEAKRKHLIDSVGTFFDVTDRMAELLEVEREKLKLDYEKQGSVISRYLNGLVTNISEELLFSGFKMR